MSERFDAWAYETAGAFALDGAEPDWRPDHPRRHAELYLAYIRARFGDDAAACARNSLLRDGDGD